MYFFDSLEQAARYCADALGQMGDREIPANPNNYAVWYVYASGANAELKRDLDILISNKDSFTEKRNHELFDRYFGNAAQSHALQDAGRRIETAIAQLQDYLGEADKSTSAYGKSLAAHGDTLDRGASADQVRQIIADLLDETRKVAEQHKRLQVQLRSSACEIGELRRSVQNIRRESLTDALTGIANRKCFDDALERAMADAMETGEELCLLLIDIDHFKKFNDTWGHQVGDEVLRGVARTFKESVKGRDLPARYGGEEFAIILPRTALDNAGIVADQIRQTVASKKIVNRNSGDSLGRITLSIGVSSFRPGESLTSFVQRADEALYAAKREGRNRVCTEDRLADSSIAAAG